jgi:hypothetical protein
MHPSQCEMMFIYYGTQYIEVKYKYSDYIHYG